jgi:hypothetical protein
MARSQTVKPVRADKPESKSGDGLVARDTVTYLDRKYDKTVAQSTRKTKSAERSVKTLARKSALRHPISNKHRSDGIAPDTVTYLDKAPTTKATKQN